MICDNVCNDHVCNLSRLHVDEYGNRQEPYGCLYDLHVNESPCNCFSLSLRVALAVVAIVGGHNHGGGATMLEMMEIMPVLWRWRSKAQEEKAISYHNFKLHVMLILLCTLLFALM